MSGRRAGSSCLALVSSKFPRIRLEISQCSRHFEPDLAPLSFLMQEEHAEFVTGSILIKIHLYNFVLRVVHQVQPNALDSNAVRKLRREHASPGSGLPVRHTPFLAGDAFAFEPVHGFRADSLSLGDTDLL